MNTSKRFSSQGFTLIELMIAMSVSLLAMIGVMSAYVAGSRANQSMQQRVAVLQDVRFAFSSLTRDLRMAGTFGCALPYAANNPLSVHDRVVGGSGWLHYIPKTIGISQNTSWTTASDFTPQGNALVIQYGVGGIDAKVTSDSGGITIQTVVPENQTISNAAVLALANCQTLELLKNDGTLSSNNFKLRADGVIFDNVMPEGQWELMRMVTMAYTIGTYRGRQGLYLFELDENGAWTGPKEIAAGFSEMNVEFGIQACEPGSANDVATRFYDSDALSGDEWQKVGLVRLGFNVKQPGLDNNGNEKMIDHTYNSTIILRRESLCMTRPA